jgi:imidazolonepropionase-like amidohydrolase
MSPTLGLAGSGFLAVLVTAPFLGVYSGPPANEPEVRAAPPARVLQIRAKELWTSAGQRVPDGLLVVADGRIRSVGSAREIDDGEPFLHHDGVVTAGLIACRTQSGTLGELQDDTRSVMEGARGMHAFEPSSRDFARALEAGITSVGIAPGPFNLVGGLACVVKTAGGRVVQPEAALALSLSATMLGRSTTQAGFAFGAAEGTAAAPEPFEGGPESPRGARGTRTPTSYSGAVALLKELFTRGDGPFGRARRGDLAVTIDAWDRHEVLRAVQLAQELGLHGAIRGAPLAGDPAVVEALKASGLGVIVGPYTAGQTTASLESVKRLAEAGVPVAFALDGPWLAPAELRLSAARALRAGAPREAVWKALTEDAARLSGAAESIGVLAPGHDADFVLWSGDPLDLSSRVLAVYVDGKLAWSAPAAH